MNKFWIIPFALLMAVSLVGAFMPQVPAINTGGPAEIGNIAWMMVATAMVMLMTPGLAFFYGGMVSTKNVVSTMLQSFICMGIVSLLWILVGFSLAFGEDVAGLGIIGNPSTFFMFLGVGAGTHADLGKAIVGTNPHIPLLLFAIFQLMFAIITPAIVTGSFAERVRFSGYLLFTCLFTLLIYCPLAHMAWHPEGLLCKKGVLDFAGGTVVHISAGVAALIGAMVLKKRKNHGISHNPANTAYVILGTGLLWFGWFGFNGGSALGANSLGILAFATTNTAAAAGALAWVFFDAIRGRKLTAMGICIGAVVGLVAVTPAAGFISIPSSIFFGSFGALISNILVYWKSTKTQVDDTLDVFPCHGVGGIVGMILTPVFATSEFGGWIATGNPHLFLEHLEGLGIVLAFVLVMSYIIYFAVNAVIPIRVNEEHEELGLDLSQHGEKLASHIKI